MVELVFSNGFQIVELWIEQSNTSSATFGILITEEPLILIGIFLATLVI